MDTTNIYREYISSMQTQIDALTSRVDSLQNAVTVCRDSIASLNTTIAGNSNWISALQSPYGLALAIILVGVVGFIVYKKGFSVKKGDTSVSVGESDK